MKSDLIVNTDEARYGVWHDACLLPALIEIPVQTQSGDLVATLAICDHCEEVRNES